MGVAQLKALRRWALALLLLAVCAASARAQDDETPADDAPTPPPQAVNVSASDFKFDPQVVSVSAGPTRFIVSNLGVVEHNFVVENSRGQLITALALIGVGKTETLDVPLDAGNYTLACTLPGHREAGMVGALTVTP